MGFFIRKSWRLGPARLNLSKSGLGASLGARGLRIGRDAKRRSYVRGGWGIFGFLYYLTGRRKR